MTTCLVLFCVNIVGIFISCDLKNEKMAKICLVLNLTAITFQWLRLVDLTGKML